MNAYYLLLALLPLSTYYLTEMYKPRMMWRLTGISFGMVIAPVSLCLLQYAYVPVIGKLIGFVGLILNLIHGSLGYFIMVGLGFLEPGNVLTGPELLAINMVNGVIWSIHYGIIGYNVDLKVAGPAHAKVHVNGYNHKPAF